MRFSVSVLALNNLQFTRMCVDSVLKYSHDFELILTNNASTDGTREYMDNLAASDPRVRVFHNATNLGFQDPNRAALAASIGELFVMLNNDTQVSENWLEELAKPFAEFPTAAVSGPKSGQSILLQSFHGSRSQNGFEYIEGSCMMVKASIVKEEGLFDPNLKFAYAEDSSLCLRMRELGYTLHLVPIRIHHHGGQTRRFVPGIDRIQMENHAYCLRRWSNYLRFRRMDYPIVIRRTGAFGDVLLTTPIIRALKKKYPVSPIWVETICGVIFRDNPNVVRAEVKFPNLNGCLVIDLNGSYESKPDENFVKTYARVANIEIDSTKTDFYTSQPDKSWAKSLIGEGTWIAIHPGPSWASKMWPESRWVTLCQDMRDAGKKVVILGNDLALYSGIPCDLDLRGRTTIHQMAAIIAECRMFIGIDSLPLHLSQAMGTPTLGLFGVTRPEPIMTEGSRWEAVCADSAHPFAGARHKQRGTTFTACTSNPMETISIFQVTEGIQRLSAK